MLLAYFDESGDSGFDNSPTAAFVLCGLLINDKNWLSALDSTVAFRRYLRDNFRIHPRTELKATWLIHNKGDIRESGLTFRSRMAVYKAAMRFQRKSGYFKTFAVLIEKSLIKKRPTDVREVAWRYAIQRLERYGVSLGENLQVFPDDGHGEFIKKKVREMRRFNYVPSAFGTRALKRNAENIVEDSSDRNSRESYFIQLADLNAYAAFRRVHPGPNFSGTIWDELDSTRISEVNRLRGGPEGIVVWP